MTPTVAAVPPHAYHRSATTQPLGRESSAQRLIREVEERDALKEFFLAEHETAVARAAIILGSRVDAEDATSETFRELLEGRTDRHHFYRALRSNAIDLRRKLARERCRQASLEGLAPSAPSDFESAAWGMEDEPAAPKEFDSRRSDELDPADILLVSESDSHHRKAVRTAMRHPRWRYIKRRKWARPLLGRCADSGSSRE